MAASWLRALPRLWLLRRVDTAERGTPVAAVALLSLGLLTAWLCIDRWQRQPDPEFALEGIPLLAWYALGLLLLAAILQRVARPRPQFAVALLFALGAAPLPLLQVSVASYFIPEPWYWFGCAGIAAYAAVYFARALHAATGRPQRLAALCGVLVLAGFIAASDALDAIPDVWNPGDPPADAAAADRTADVEEALFEEADRIDAALETVQRAPSSASQAFFLGVAGVGEQRVFAQEIALASRVLGERYHIDGRHLSLINDARDLERTPLANVPGLDYALRALAERMDPERDVLFLAISSHGSPDPSIALSNGQVPFTALSAQALAGALRDSGIRWRVIILSACYAGGFIEALRDARTIVITAAAKDRTSFGCSNDSDLTYFGEAFYRDALPEAATLQAAFEAAKRAIAARERDEHFTPSDPQAFFGAEMEKKLAGLER